MYNRGIGARLSRGRGRGTRTYRGKGQTQRDFAGIDVRDKLIGSRKPVGDARNVIREHVVHKVGDLRAMLHPKKGQAVRPGGDLRVGLVGRVKNVKNSNRPKLVYADNLPDATNTKRYRNPQNSNVTVGKGGKVTISRPRGRSIDRDEEVVQPTGIPAHMRRQPSLPSRSVATRSASHSPPPAKYHAPPTTTQPQQQSFNRRRSSTPPPSPPQQRSYSPPPVARPQSYIVSPQKRPPPPSRRPGYAEDFQDLPPDRVYDYRHRSRSPLNRDYIRRSISPNARNSSYLYPPNNSPPPDHYLRRRAPSPPLERYRDYGAYGTNAMRGEYRDRFPFPLPLRQEIQGQGVFGNGFQGQMGLRMDRVSNSDRPQPNYHPRERPPEVAERRRPPPVVRNPGHNPTTAPTTTTTHYTVKVTSLSHEVSEDDVVELFSDIGPLISAKLITKGHAEVCFVNKKDAKTAIEKYDRRELDGIPMNLKLVEKSVAVSSPRKASKLLSTSRSSKVKTSRNVRL